MKKKKKTVKVENPIHFAVMTKGPDQRVFFASRKGKKAFVNPFNAKHDRFGETDRIASRIASGKQTEGDVLGDLSRSAPSAFNVIAQRKVEKNALYQEALNESYEWSLYSYASNTNSIELVASFDHQIFDMIIDPTTNFIALLGDRVVTIFHVPTANHKRFDIFSLSLSSTLFLSSVLHDSHIWREKKTNDVNQVERLCVPSNKAMLGDWRQRRTHRVLVLSRRLAAATTATTTTRPH